jgi:starvation-inducible DNA-binding protein
MAAKDKKQPKSTQAKYTVPGLEIEDGHRVAEILQLRLHALNDLQLTLKHAHWNVVGPNFIGVHEMLDPQIEEVRGAVDVVAERIATLGVSPQGTPGTLVAQRTWDDYSLGRADTIEHIAALDQVYDGVIADHRNAIEECGKLDPITEDILIGQTGDLEQFQWFLRAFLTNNAGELSTEGATTEKDAAKQGAAKKS